MSRFDGIATIGFQGDRASARKAIGLVQDEANRTKIRLNIETGKGFAPLGKISSDLNQFQASLDASVARTLAFGASVGVIGGVTRAFRDMLAAGIAVEKSIADINAVFKLGNAQLQTFSSGLFDIAKNTKQSFDKVTQAATEFSRQGLSVEETLKRTGSAMTLVRLAGIDTATAVNSLTAAMNGFSSAGLDSVEIINKLTTVDAAFAVSTSDLVQGLSRAGDVAQSAGVSFDELLAAVTAVQQRTARGGAIIGNSLKTIFTRLQSPENAKALESIGVSVYDSNGAFREGIQVLKDYAAARSGLADSERAGLDKKLAGGYQINSFLALIAELKDEYGAFSQAVKVSSGATDEAAKRMALLDNTVSALGSKLSATGTQLSSLVFDSVFESGTKKGLKFFQMVGDGLTSLLNPETIKGGGLKGVMAGAFQGAFEGAGKFIFGGGGIEALRVMSKLVTFLAAEAYKAAAQVSNIGSQKQKEEQYARRISTLLQQDVEYMKLMGNGSLTNLEFQKETAKALERQALIAERILAIQKQIRAFVPANPAIVSRVIKDTGGKGGGLFGAAGGYSPIDLGKAKEKGMIENGVGGARLSDKPRVIRGFDFGGGKKGTIVANTGEHYVPNFGGVGDAIFNREMIAKHGLPSGAVPVAGGFVPPSPSRLFARKAHKAMQARGKVSLNPDYVKQILSEIGAPKGIDMASLNYFLKMEAMGSVGSDHGGVFSPSAFAVGFVPNFARTKKENPFAPIDTFFVNALLKKEMRAVRDGGLDYTSPEGKRETLLGVEGKLKALNLSSAAKEEAIKQLARVTRDYATYSPSDVRVEGGKKDAKYASVAAREAEVAKREELNQKQRDARVVEYDLSEKVGLIYGRRGGLTSETYRNFDKSTNLSRIIKFQQAGMKLENPDVDAQLDSLHEKVWKDAQYTVNSYIGAITGTRPTEDIPATSFSNKNAVNSLLGTAFETALSQTMGSKLEREGGQNATIDFPSPTQPMRSLFHGMTAAQYEAKYIPNDDAHKSLFNKAVRLGLVDSQFSAAKLSAMDAAYASKQTAAGGFVPNFAMDMRWASDRMDSVVRGRMVKRLDSTGSRLGLPTNKVSLKNLTPKIGENIVGGLYRPEDHGIQVHARDDVSVREIEEILAHEYGHFIDYAHPSAKETGVKMSDLPTYRSEAKQFIRRYLRNKKDPKVPKWVKKSLSTILAHKNLYTKDNYYEELYADGVAELHGPRRHPVSKSRLGSLIASDIRLPKKGFAGGYVPNFARFDGYHGTPHTGKINKLLFKYGGGNTSSPDSSNAIFFTSSEREASFYRSPNGVGQIVKSRLDIKNPFVIDAKGVEKDRAFGNAGYKKLIQMAVAKGHDGAVIKNIRDYSGDIQDTYIVFSDGKKSGVDVESFGSGYVPNFSAIEDAMGREAAAIGDSGGVRIGTHPSLRSPFNKEGIGVYNNREGSLGAGIQMARMAGVGDVKSKGMVPNFASSDKYTKLDMRVADEIKKAGSIKIYEIIKNLAEEFKGIKIKDVAESLDALGVAVKKTTVSASGKKTTTSTRGYGSAIKEDMIPTRTKRGISSQIQKKQEDEEARAAKEKDAADAAAAKRAKQQASEQAREAKKQEKIVRDQQRAAEQEQKIRAKVNKSLDNQRLAEEGRSAKAAEVAAKRAQQQAEARAQERAKASEENAAKAANFENRPEWDYRREKEKQSLMANGKYKIGTKEEIRAAAEAAAEAADKAKREAEAEKKMSRFGKIQRYLDTPRERNGVKGKRGESAFSEGKGLDKMTRGMNAFFAQMVLSSAAGGLAAAGFTKSAKAAESIASGFQVATTAAALIPGPLGTVAGVAVGVGAALFNLTSTFADKTNDLAKSLDDQILKNAEVTQSVSGAIASYDKFSLAMEKNDPARAFRAYSEMSEQIGKAATTNPAVSGKFFSAIAEKDPEKRTEALQKLQDEVSKNELRSKEARDSIELARKLGEGTLTGPEGRGILQKRQDENFSYADLSKGLKEITESLRKDSSRSNADAQYEKLKTMVDNPEQLEAIRTAIYESGVDGWFDVTSSLVEFLNNAASNLGEGADTKSFLEEMTKKMRPILDAEIAARKKAMEASNKFEIAMLKASVSTQFFASQLKGQFDFESKMRGINFESASDILGSLNLIRPEDRILDSGARAKTEIGTAVANDKRILGVETATKLDELAAKIGTGQNPKDTEALSKLAELSSRLKSGENISDIGGQMTEENFRKLLDKDGKDSKTEEYLKDLIKIGADAINSDKQLSDTQTREIALSDAKTRAELRKAIVDRYQNATMDSGGFVQTQKDIRVLAGRATTVEGADAKIEADARTGQKIGYRGSEDIDLLIKKRMLAQAETLQENSGAYVGNRALIEGGQEEVLAKANQKLEELKGKGSLSGEDQAAKSLYEQIVAQSRVVNDSQSDYNDTTPKGPSAEVSAIYAGLQTASNTLKRDFDALKQATLELGKAMEETSDKRGRMRDALEADNKYEKPATDLAEKIRKQEGINEALDAVFVGKNKNDLTKEGKEAYDSVVESAPRDYETFLKVITEQKNILKEMKDEFLNLRRQSRAAKTAFDEKPTNARGYISRNFASGKSNRISEMLAASAAGYKTPLSSSEVRTGIIDGNVVTYNSRESIVRSGGATAIIPPRDSKAFNSFGKNAAAGSDSYGNKELASILREIQRGQEKVIAAVQSNRTVSLDGDVGINANISAAISSANLSSEVSQIIKAEIEKSLPALIKKAVQDSVSLSVKTMTRMF